VRRHGSQSRLQDSFIQSLGNRLLFGNICVARANRSHDFTGKFSATIAESRMAFPTMIEMRRKEAVQIISETLLKLLALHSTLRNCLLQNTSFKFSRRRRHRCHVASFDCAANCRESFMAHGTLHRVLTHEPICFRTYYALKVVGQKIFEIHTKHRYFSASRRLLFWLTRPPAKN
jgi:hypothetical protein